MADSLYSTEQAAELCALSRQLGKQIGVIVNRKGRVEGVILGNSSGLIIPPFGRERSGLSRLRGFGLLHTHLYGEGISQEDLMDLIFLRLDYIAVLGTGKDALPSFFQYAHLLPDSPQNKDAYFLSERLDALNNNVELAEIVTALEEEFARSKDGAGVKNVSSNIKMGAKTGTKSGSKASAKKDAAPPAHFLPEKRAILISISSNPKALQELHLKELASLAEAADLTVCDSIAKKAAVSNERVLMGEGRLAELEVIALKHNAGLLIFDGELSPAQIDNLAKITELKVIDRTMLILDIFAQRARSGAGKLQVEMAQLKYALPRLAGRSAGRAMDRLAGGIGGRGLGETKLEMDRRKIRSRLAHIKKELKELSAQRTREGERRQKAGTPSVCLVGYTNAGKSTLLNSLAKSTVFAANMLFATLDPTYRRICVPTPQPLAKEEESGGDFDVKNQHANPCTEFILSDTVGFIRDLPEPLKEAFKSTLDALASASLLIHVADASHPELVMQVESVEKILAELELDQIPCLLVLNKWDAVLTTPFEGESGNVVGKVRDLEKVGGLAGELDEPREANENTQDGSQESMTQESITDDAGVTNMMDILARYPNAMPVSAKSGQGLDYLLQKIEKYCRELALEPLNFEKALTSSGIKPVIATGTIAISGGSRLN